MAKLGRTDPNAFVSSRGVCVLVMKMITRRLVWPCSVY